MPRTIIGSDKRQDAQQTNDTDDLSGFCISRHTAKLMPLRTSYQSISVFSKGLVIGMVEAAIRLVPHLRDSLMVFGQLIIQYSPKNTDCSRSCMGTLLDTRTQCSSCTYRTCVCRAVVRFGGPYVAYACMQGSGRVVATSSAHRTSLPAR